MGKPDSSNHPSGTVPDTSRKCAICGDPFHSESIRRETCRKKECRRRMKSRKSHRKEREKPWVKCRSRLGDRFKAVMKRAGVPGPYILRPYLKASTRKVKVYFQRLFRDGMSWESYGFNVWSDDDPSSQSTEVRRTDGERQSTEGVPDGERQSTEVRRTDGERQSTEKNDPTGRSNRKLLKRGMVIDHIVPCNVFDLSNPEHVKVCWHISNLRPEWHTENLQKHDRVILEIIPEELRRKVEALGIDLVKLARGK